MVVDVVDVVVGTVVLVDVVGGRVVDGELVGGVVGELVLGGRVVTGGRLDVGPVVAVVPPEPPVGDGMMSPVTVSTVVFGASGTTTASPLSSTTRARVGSGRRISPSGPKDMAVAGWLGGTSTSRPSASVGNVMPSDVGMARRVAASSRLIQIVPITSTAMPAAMTTAPTYGEGAARPPSRRSPSPTGQS